MKNFKCKPETSFTIRVKVLRLQIAKIDQEKIQSVFLHSFDFNLIQSKGKFRVI